MTATLTRDRAQSRWWDQFSTARLLHRAAAEGAVIEDLAEWLGSDDPDEALGQEYADWFLNVDFPLPGTSRVTVRYTADSACWLLLVDTEDLPRDPDTQSAAAYTVSVAAKLCRDLNSMIKRQYRDPSGAIAVGEEIEALMCDRGLARSEFATRLGLTVGTLAAKFNGSVYWSAVDLLRVTSVLAEGDDRAELLERLLGMVDD